MIPELLPAETNTMDSKVWTHSFKFNNFFNNACMHAMTINNTLHTIKIQEHEGDFK